MTVKTTLPGPRFFIKEFYVPALDLSQRYTTRPNNNNNNNNNTIVVFNPCLFFDIAFVNIEDDHRVHYGDVNLLTSRSHAPTGTSPIAQIPLRFLTEKTRKTPTHKGPRVRINQTHTTLNPTPNHSQRVETHKESRLTKSRDSQRVETHKESNRHEEEILEQGEKQVEFSWSLLVTVLSRRRGLFNSPQEPTSTEAEGSGYWCHRFPAEKSDQKRGQKSREPNQYIGGEINRFSRFDPLIGSRPILHVGFFKCGLAPRWAGYMLVLGHR
ncbi:hypothetical protein MIMGU_mgv11b020926mg [Erythranthe guttata]|uniref:Uncharacterized protein n=1 Tax=Erythranthe guttata TaxID=4155 RepID=A0A022QB86_ERYGU|nr:hypothetical protein MIMGU_mgv11b020926mg [Erythranthe guttata]